MMPSRSFLLNAAVLMLAISTTPAVGRAATIANGGFETGDLTGWSLTNASAFDAVCANGNTLGSSVCVSNSGTYAMGFGNFGTLTTLSQTIATVPGAVYLISFYLTNDNPTGDPDESFAMSWDGTTVFSLPSPQGSFAYSQRVVLNLMATTTSTVLAFDAQHDPAQWFLDDISISDVPEPASVLLTAAGLASLVALRRRVSSF